MATLVLMPQKGLTETSALLSKWYVKKGDSVKAGDYLFAIETQKATFDVESEAEGIVLETIGAEGDEIPTKAVVCVIGRAGESYRTAPAQPAQEAAAREEAHAPPQGETRLLPQADLQAGTDRLRISPRARLLSEKRHVDPSALTGSGPRGRIMEADILTAPTPAPAPPAKQDAVQEVPRPAQEPAQPMQEAPAYTAVKHSMLRRTIAANMHASLSELAQLTMHTTFDATEALEYRKKVKASGEAPLQDITLGSMIVFALSRVLPAYPAINAHYTPEQTLQFQNAHIGVAVDTEHGLMVPTIAYADRLSLRETASRIAQLAEACRTRTIRPEQMTGASFTLTNLGALGVTGFTPVINPPQAAILGVGAVEYRRRPAGDGFVDYPAITLSLTFDHRALDGAPAAKFLQALVRRLESFSLLLAD